MFWPLKSGALPADLQEFLLQLLMHGGGRRTAVRRGKGSAVLPLLWE